MKRIEQLTISEATRVLIRCQEALLAEEWDADTLAYIAGAFLEAGLLPDPSPESSPEEAEAAP